MGQSEQRPYYDLGQRVFNLSTWRPQAKSNPLPDFKGEAKGEAKMNPSLTFWKGYHYQNQKQKKSYKNSQEIILIIYVRLKWYWP